MSKKHVHHGDGGKTSILDCTGLSKTDPIVGAIGDLDELDAHIAHVHDLLDSDDDLFGAQRSFLIGVCKKMWLIKALIASVRSSHLEKREAKCVDADDIAGMEDEIDGMNAELPELTKFVFMGGNSIVSATHIARTLCRRAERSIVGVNAGLCPIGANTLTYINRLSLYLFTLSRYIGHKLNVPEVAVRDA